MHSLSLSLWRNFQLPVRCNVAVLLVHIMRNNIKSMIIVFDKYYIERRFSYQSDEL